MMEGRRAHRHINPHHQQQQQSHVSIGGVDSPTDRFPQWSLQETTEFLMIRAALDQSFMETKRNKLLWEDISTKMKELGYNRSAEQCRCKWKNLVTRYKGCETVESEDMRNQFPFYNEMQAIFALRMQRMMWAEEEGGASSSKKKASQLSWDEEEEDEASEGEEQKDVGSSDRKKTKKNKKAKPGYNTGASSTTSNHNSRNLVKLVEEFMKQQVQMEMQWREAYEARENERRAREMEWRRRMEALEKERIVMERRWREREEQRRIREDARAEKSDALITALLNKLRSRGDM